MGLPCLGVRAEVVRVLAAERAIRNILIENLRLSLGNYTLYLNELRVECVLWQKFKFQEELVLLREECHAAFRSYNLRT